MGAGRVKFRFKQMGLLLFISALIHFLLLFLISYIWPEDSQKLANLKSQKLKKFQVVNLIPMNNSRPKVAKYLAEFDQKTNKERKAQVGPKSLETNKNFNKPKKAFGHKQADDPLGIMPKFASFTKDSIDAVNGDTTELNAWKWDHAPFFNRIKEQIASIWSPLAQINRHDPNGKLLGQTNRVTVLSISINKIGELIDLSIKNPSGVNYLDEEALRALKKASPFLYPPQELFKNNNTFSFDFAFHVEVNRGISLNFD
jgi:TonB family protein